MLSARFEMLVGLGCKPGPTAKRPASASRYVRVVLGRIDFNTLASAFRAASGVS